MSRIWMGAAWLVGCAGGDAVQMNEVGMTGIGDGFVELYNPSQRDIDVDGWSLTFDTPDRSDEAPLSLDGRVAAGGVREVVLPLGWEVGSGSGVLTLLRPDATEHESVNVPSLASSDSYGLVPDGAPNWQIIAPSPGELNAP